MTVDSTEKPICKKCGEEYRPLCHKDNGICMHCRHSENLERVEKKGVGI